MDKTYWIDRQRDALVMARGAATSEARLAHYELAGRYGIRAAHSRPFMLPNKAPATEGERVLLRLRPSAPLRPARTFNDARGKPKAPRRDGPGGRGR
jgi:hypothetical protein